MPHLSRLTDRPRRWLLVLLVLAVTSLASPVVPPASAHGDLLFSDPADQGLTEVLPSRARLTFSDMVEEVQEISVTGPDGSVTNGDPNSNGPEVTQNLWAGPDGAYTMEYFVVLSDGHDVRGEVQFEVGSLATGAAADATSSTTADGSSGPDVLAAWALVILAAAVALALALVLRARRRTAGQGSG